ncbi:unnamed protein product [Medioppia subpectinata]|uniref:BHLH domain-containing protein n=1 Tax=Medioppia subpectinata TaxID=1979941 RepID=A0A7R9KI36_9ACAR|nr:unnamed protein product [Medioppia subpectinata]CAG2103920.1 unnamed protein product [Medioppia subpectinata]
MEPIVFIDSLDNISIVNLNVPSLSPSRDHLYDDFDCKHASALLSDHLDEECPQESPFAFDLHDDPMDASYRSHHRRTTSSLDKVRTWKKYKNKKHLSQLELDRKRDLANKQERRRMHRLNDALNRLRAVIPAELQHPPPRRLSKIKTLQSAIKYIRRLQELLRDNN